MGCNDREGPCFKTVGCRLDEGHNGECKVRECQYCQKPFGESESIHQCADGGAAMRQAYPGPYIKTEAVDHPAHYGGKDDPHEHVKCAEAVGLDRDAMLYNCTKYIWRFGKKGVTKEIFLEDLKKARWYLDRRIARLEGEGK